MGDWLFFFLLLLFEVLALARAIIWRIKPSILSVAVTCLTTKGTFVHGFLQLSNVVVMVRVTYTY
jgi:hypothetical protein